MYKIELCFLTLFLSKIMKGGSDVAVLFWVIQLLFVWRHHHFVVSTIGFRGILRCSDVNFAIGRMIGKVAAALASAGTITFMGYNSYRTNRLKAKLSDEMSSDSDKSILSDISIDEFPSVRSLLPKSSSTGFHSEVLLSLLQIRKSINMKRYRLCIFRWTLVRHIRWTIVSFP